VNLTFQQNRQDLAKRPFGIVVRYSDSLNDRVVDTIGEHNHLIASQGCVFVGKFGTPIAQKYIDLCNSQQRDVRLILAAPKAKRGTGRLIYSSRIAGAQKSKPSLKLFPKYYHDYSPIKTWFKLCSPLLPLPDGELSQWKTLSSGSPLLESLTCSMSGVFYAVLESGSLIPHTKSLKKSSKESLESSDEFLDFFD